MRFKCNERQQSHQNVSQIKPASYDPLMSASSPTEANNCLGKSVSQQSDGITLGIHLGATGIRCGWFDGKKFRYVEDRRRSNSSVWTNLIFIDDTQYIAGYFTKYSDENHVCNLTLFKEDPWRGYQEIHKGKNISMTIVTAFALLFQDLMKKAVSQFQKEVQGCVIAVNTSASPAYRKGVKLAVELAGIRNIRIINETTAAALHWFQRTSYRDKFDSGADRSRVLAVRCDNDDQICEATGFNYTKTTESMLIKMNYFNILSKDSGSLGKKFMNTVTNALSLGTYGSPIPRNNTILEEIKNGCEKAPEQTLSIGTQAKSTVDEHGVVPQKEMPVCGAMWLANYLLSPKLIQIPEMLTCEINFKQAGCNIYSMTKKMHIHLPFTDVICIGSNNFSIPEIKLRIEGDNTQLIDELRIPVENRDKNMWNALQLKVTIDENGILDTTGKFKRGNEEREAVIHRTFFPSMDEYKDMFTHITNKP